MIGRLQLFYMSVAGNECSDMSYNSCGTIGCCEVSHIPLVSPTPQIYDFHKCFSDQSLSWGRGVAKNQRKRGGECHLGFSVHGHHKVDDVGSPSNPPPRSQAGLRFVLVASFAVQEQAACATVSYPDCSNVQLPLSLRPFLLQQTHPDVVIPFVVFCLSVVVGLSVFCSLC